MLRKRVIASSIAVGVLAGAGAAAGDLPPLDLETVESGFSLPLQVVQDPQNPDVQFVVQQRGRIRVLVNGEVQAQDFLDLTGIVSTTGNERGLLGLAFPPDPDDDRFYVNYTANIAGADDTRIVRYQRDPNNPLLADPNSAEIVLEIDQIFENHNGGNIAFGSDGFLYIGMGDGGGAGDTQGAGQNPDTLLGKMLRIDVSPETGYDIPADNPFVDDDPIDALEEIWAFGLRNPWRWSFDPVELGGTGALIIADVGQNSWEEVNYEPAGAGGRNYGWRNREGMHPFNNTDPPAYEPLTDPIYEYSHSVGRSITGGFVYRGTELGPEFYGRYFFADFVFRRIWSMGLDIDENGEATVVDVVEHTAELGGSSAVGNLSSFGIDENGEIYFTNFSGQVKKIVSPVINVQPEGFTRLRGLPVSGDVTDLQTSDDSRLSTRPDVFAPTNIPPVQIEVIGTSPVGRPSEFSVTVEGRASVDNIRQEILFWNYNQSTWDLLDTRVIPTSDTTVDVSVENGAPYIEDGTGEMRVLLRYNAVAFSILPTWRGEQDLVRWSIIE